MAWQDDALFVVNPKQPCKVCGGGRRARKKCDPCRGSGFEPISLAGLWAPQPGFLVCGGPSLQQLPLDLLKQRGIVSFAINNAAAYAPVSAYTFGDPQYKFHSACHFDPKCLTFAPIGKLRRTVRIKAKDHDADGDVFRFTDVRLFECPGVYGIARTGRFNADKFFSTYYAHWGHGGQTNSEQPFRRLATMLMGIRMLHYLGCPRVYMLGVDFTFADKTKPGYAWGDPASAGNKIWKKINAMLAGLVPTFEAAGFEVFNCNPDSNCEPFDYVSFEQAYNDCKGPIEDEPLDVSEWYGKKRMVKDKDKYPELLSRDEAIRLLRT